MSPSHHARLKIPSGDMSGVRGGKRANSRVFATRREELNVNGRTGGGFIRLQKTVLRSSNETNGGTCCGSASFRYSFQKRAGTAEASTSRCSALAFAARK